MNVWAVIAVVGAATVAIKATGPVLLGGRALPARASNAVELLAPAVLAALVVTQTVADGRSLVLDARAVGVAAGATAIVLRLPLLAVIGAAAAATALVRLV